MAYKKLRNEEIMIIRDLYSTGKYTMNKLALLFGVSQPTIYKYVHSEKEKERKQFKPIRINCDFDEENYGGAEYDIRLQQATESYRITEIR